MPVTVEMKPIFELQCLRVLLVLLVEVGVHREMVASSPRETNDDWVSERWESFIRAAMATKSSKPASVSIMSILCFAGVSVEWKEKDMNLNTDDDGSKGGIRVQIFKYFHSFIAY